MEQQAAIHIPGVTKYVIRHKDSRYSNRIVCSTMKIAQARLRSMLGCDDYMIEAQNPPSYMVSNELL